MILLHILNQRSISAVFKICQFLIWRVYIFGWIKEFFFYVTIPLLLIFLINLYTEELS